MKTSELIVKLQAALIDSGDVKVVVDSYSGNHHVIDAGLDEYGKNEFVIFIGAERDE